MATARNDAYAGDYYTGGDGASHGMARPGHGQAHGSELDRSMSHIHLNLRIKDSRKCMCEKHKNKSSCFVLQSKKKTLLGHENRLLEQLDMKIVPLWSFSVPDPVQRARKKTKEPKIVFLSRERYP